MNDIDKILNVLNDSKYRRIGKTHMVASFVKKNGGVMVCINKENAKMVTKQYGIYTTCYHSILNNTLELRGCNNVFWDQDAFIFFLEEFNRKVKKTENLVNVIEKRCLTDMDTSGIKYEIDKFKAQ